MKKKLGFALGAGGSRGVAHVGFLKAMEENGIIPDYISGCSMGSVVGSCYAVGMTPEQMITEVKKLKASELLDLSLNPLGGGALMRTKKIRKKLGKFIGNTTFNDLKIPFTAVAVDLISGELHDFGGDMPVLDCVIASSTIPSVFQPTEIDGKMYVDGGVLNRVPIKEVRGMGAEVVVAVDVLGETRVCDKRYNIFTLLLRVHDIMDGEITARTFKTETPEVLIKPDLGEMSQYKIKDFEFAYEQGYKAGIENVAKIKELLGES